MRVLMPARILDRHVGGNTTYSRHLADGLTSRGVTVGRIRAGRWAAATALLETVAGLTRHDDGTVLHYTADSGPLLATRSPCVVTIHGVASRWVPGVRSPTAERVWRTRVAAAARHADRVITVSSSSARDVVDVFGVPEDKVVVVPHGIDPPAADLGAGGGGGPARGPYALYVGNIEPRKNVANLVRAFDDPRLRRAGVRLVVAGRPAWGYQEALREIAASDRVDHLGFVSDADRTALVRGCELFVFPSRYEGFGFPVLEAMALGAPVVTSRNGALAEIAGPARILESLGPDGIADGVLDALADQSWRDRAATDGPRWAGRFSWDASVGRHVDVYRAVLAG
ncbi:glycosyltransferase family 4 protein [Cellulomonas sp. URHB0016]